MAILCLTGITVIYGMEAHGNPLLHGIDQHASATQAGGNMEGKEVRFGLAQTSIFHDRSLRTQAAERWTPCMTRLPRWAG